MISFLSVTRAHEGQSLQASELDLPWEDESRNTDPVASLHFDQEPDSLQDFLDPAPSSHSAPSSKPLPVHTCFHLIDPSDGDDDEWSFLDSPAPSSSSKPTTATLDNRNQRELQRIGIIKDRILKLSVEEFKTIMSNISEEDRDIVYAVLRDADEKLNPHSDQRLLHESDKKLRGMSLRAVILLSTPFSGSPVLYNRITVYKVMTLFVEVKARAEGSARYLNLDFNPSSCAQPNSYEMQYKGPSERDVPVPTSEDIETYITRELHELSFSNVPESNRMQLLQELANKYSHERLQVEINQGKDEAIPFMTFAASLIELEEELKASKFNDFASPMQALKKALAEINAKGVDAKSAEAMMKTILGKLNDLLNIEYENIQKKAATEGVLGQTLQALNTTRLQKSAEFAQKTSESEMARMQKEHGELEKMIAILRSLDPNRPAMIQVAARAIEARIKTVQNDPWVRDFLTKIYQFLMGQRNIHGVMDGGLVHQIAKGDHRGAAQGLRNTIHNLNEQKCELESVIELPQALPLMPESSSSSSSDTSQPAPLSLPEPKKPKAPEPAQPTSSFFAPLSSLFSFGFSSASAPEIDVEKIKKKREKLGKQVKKLGDKRPIDKTGRDLHIKDLQTKVKAQETSLAVVKGEVAQLHRLAEQLSALHASYPKPAKINTNKHREIQSVLDQVSSSLSQSAQAALYRETYERIEIEPARDLTPVGDATLTPEVVGKAIFGAIQSSYVNSTNPLTFDERARDLKIVAKKHQKLVDSMDTTISRAKKMIEKLQADPASKKSSKSKSSRKK